MNEITLRAHAKINLTLDVGARRADGYHELRSVMQTISLHDTLTLRLVPGQRGIVLEVSGDEAEGVPADASNLAHRAAARLWENVPPKDKFGLHLHLQKQIPAQAGLGGGSSDAACALRAANLLLGLNFSVERLAEIAAELGADVPFFLHGGCALAEGIGERVTPLPDLAPPWPLVIVKPPVGVSTAVAYKALDDAGHAKIWEASDFWLSGKFFLKNDFHPVIVPAFPEIAAAYEFLATDPDRFLETPPLLSGSGSALFCRAIRADGAERMAERARQAGIGKAWATETVGRRH